MPQSRGGIILIAGVALLASFAAFGWTLDGYFVGDDFGFIGRYHDFPFARWPELFTRAWADGLWTVDLREIRPLNALAFMIDARAWGANPTGFRLTNLLLHATCAWLTGLIALRATRGNRGVALVAALLFVLHPATSHAVAWISGRVDVLSTCFSLGAFLAFLRFRQDAEAGVGTLGLLGCGLAGALFTKESGLTVPGLLLAADVLWLHALPRWRERRTWAPYLVCIAVLLAYGFCRWTAFGETGPNSIGRGFGSVIEGGFSDFVRRQAGYVSHLLLPPARLWLREWHADGFPLKGSVFILIAFLAGAIGSGAVFLWRGQSRVRASRDCRAFLFFGAGWYVVTTVPLLATYYSARHLYPAAAGLAIAAALLLRWIFCTRISFGVAAAVLVAVFGQQLIVTLRPWHDAAKLSGVIAREISITVRESPSPSALLLDVPALVGDSSFCWSWAIPYATRPPFMSERLDATCIVLGPPEVHALRERWATLPMFDALGTISGPCWLIEADRNGTVQRTQIPAATVRRAAAQLATRRDRMNPEAWTKFRHELVRP